MCVCVCVRERVCVCVCVCDMGRCTTSHIKEEAVFEPRQVCAVAEKGLQHIHAVKADGDAHGLDVAEVLVVILRFLVSFFLRAFPFLPLLLLLDLFLLCRLRDNEKERSS